MNVNEGHRSRMRQRMMKEGLQSFQDHEVLELLLFQYIPRKDTNKLAHDLLNKFGSLANVLEASPEQLMLVKGVSEVTACNIAVLKEIWLRYKTSAANKITLSSLGSIIRYAQQLVVDSYVEKLVVVYVDASDNFLISEEYCSDTTDYVMVDIKKVVSTALRANASGIMLFHCHVKSICTPSREDYAFTEKMYMTLANMNIILLEHIIVNGDGEYFSFFREGIMDSIADKYKKIKIN